MKPDTSRWRDARSYDHFDDLSVEGLAWECLRRDPAYQQAYRKLEQTEQQSEPLDEEGEKRWGLRFCGRSGVAGLRSADPLVPDSQPRHYGARAYPQEIGSWPATADVADRFLETTNPAPIFLAGPKVDRAVAALIALDDTLPDRVEALLRLWQGMQGRSSPPDRRITAQQRKRMRLMMQAFDGRSGGASYRAIAEVLFGTERVRSDPWKTSSLRDKVIGLVEGGSSLVAGGYLRLFRQRRRLTF